MGDHAAQVSRSARSDVDVAAYLVKERLKDGNEITIRGMRADDKKRLIDAFLHLQPHTIRTRFFYQKKTLSENDLRWLDEMGQWDHVGLVATVIRGGDELIVGEASFAAVGRTAEVGLTVAEAWQGRGLATRLLQHLAGIARDHGVAEFEAYVLQENTRMLAVFRGSGFPTTIQYADSLVHITLALDSPTAR